MPSKIRQTHYHKEILAPLERFDQKTRDDIYLALFKFGTFGEEPTFSDPIVSMWWEMARGTLERLNSRRWNGNNGGRPTENHEDIPSDNQAITDNPIINNLTETEQEPSDNQAITETKPPVPVPVTKTNFNNLAAAAAPAELFEPDAYAPAELQSISGDNPDSAPKNDKSTSSSKTPPDVATTKIGAQSGNQTTCKQITPDNAANRPLAAAMQRARERMAQKQAEKKGGAAYGWQDFAHTFAERLKIDYSGDPDSWFKVFKKAEDKGKTHELRAAETHLFDSETWKKYSNDRKIKCIYYIAHHGLEKFKALGKRRAGS